MMNVVIADVFYLICYNVKKDYNFFLKGMIMKRRVITRFESFGGGAL